MKTPRTVFFTKPGLWLSLLCSVTLLLAGCSGGSGGGASDASQASGAGAGGSANIRVNGMLLAASAQQPVVTSGSDDEALISSQRATAPKTLETISFALGTSNANARSVKWQFGSDASDLVGGQLTKTAVLSNGVIPSVTVAFKTAGIKTVTSNLYSTADASGTPLSTETIRMYVDARPPVTKTAIIASASSGGTAISNPGQTGATSLTLNGTYSSNLGADYGVQVFDGASPLGAATLNADPRTWSYTANNLSLSEHTFTVKVVRTADSVAGNASDKYTVSVGNTLTASNSTPNLWDEFTLTLSNMWNNVGAVRFTLTTDSSDMADGIETKISGFVNRAWQTVTTAFKTAGKKTITAEFIDNEVNVVATRSINVTVGANVTQTATITDVIDGANSSIPPNGTTSNAKPTITGTVNTALGTYHKVIVYDGNSQLTGNMTYGNPRTSWEFTPTTPLSNGSRTLTAKVATFDGVVTGVISEERKLTVSNYSQVVKSGNVFYEKTECVLDKSTGYMWEGKPADGTTRGSPALDPKSLYTNNLNDSSDGNANGYVNAVNTTGLCGFKDWRLPTKDELLGIVDSTLASSPKVDANWFPNTSGYNYWTSSPYENNQNFAWSVYFDNGVFAGFLRPYRFNVRLVRNTQKYSQVVKSGNVFYEKTECVKDNNTGLVWEGKPAAGTRRGSPTALNTSGLYTNKLNDITDSNALGYVNAVKSAKLCGFTNWRLPTKEELSGIVDSTVATSPKVDVNWFPNTQSAIYWTLSPDVSDSAWDVDFNDGYVSKGFSRIYNSYVRLVHD